ncbi:WYL domain-containing protein [Helicobacter sp. 11S02629-2]|uniref:helix-turn-helix transcriptional regulator n=1 Tax=Helicobacter sp. 11S02629-2 TaxID=1476195 RepID=UPI000BA4F787|nr:WYL domain-containing protein [Helicobacter sp. 11S02629-2]PAF45527.1 hypothetical protein BKH40_03440 [Helicobacter sp. 11S02629-2]
MPTSHDKIAMRLAQIITKLNDGEELDLKDLAREFNVSIRTIQRDFNDRLTSLPLDKTSGIYKLEEHSLGKLSYKDIKNFAAVSGILNLYPQLSNEFISSLLNKGANTPYKININTYEELQARDKDFEKLNDAILNHNVITFTYSDKKRELNPYKLINNNGIWYLAGTEEEDLKMYAFSKIQKLKVLNKTFSSKEELVQKIETNNANWFAQKVTEVTLEIKKPLIEFFLRRKILPNQKIVKQSEEKLVLSTNVAYEEEMLGVVKRGIPHIKILKPKDLNDKLKALLKAYIQNI